MGIKWKSMKPALKTTLKNLEYQMKLGHLICHDQRDVRPAVDEFRWQGNNSLKIFRGA